MNAIVVYPSKEEAQTADLRIVAVGSKYAVEFRSRDRWASSARNLSAEQAFEVYDRFSIKD